MKTKLPNNLKKGLKVFGVILGLSLLTNQVDAILKPTKTNPLPISTISDEFPKSYQRYIDNLKKIYPNSTFKAVYTGLNWDTVLKHETYETNQRISTVPKSYASVWKMNGENIKIDGSFVAASKSAVAYVLDPRNSLYEKRIFQFEGLTYNESITPEVIEKVIVGSPMVGIYSNKYKNAGQWLEMDLSYAQIIDKVGQETKVSSVYIASRLIQETSGDIVNNGSVNGSNATYPGVYNFFNIGATPNSDGTGSVLNGLKHAKSQGWTTPYLSILGGVKKIKSTYIAYGQDTVYFQKFDVNNPYNKAKALMAYQYQTNILAPINESKISYNAYKKLEMLDTAFVFYIPVYNNMPEDPTPYPAGDSAKFDEDNTKVYLDDLESQEDVFNIRTSANTELENVICKITETSSNPDERLIMTRVKKGNGYDWDVVEFELNGEKIHGYVWNDYVQVYNYVKVENITLDKQTAELEEGETLTLLATIAPENARFKEVIWASSNEEILTVESGILTGKRPGEVIVTATTEDGGKVATCNVTVKERTHDIKTDLEEYTVEEGQTVIPNVTLKNIENYELKVIDENIAKVVDKSIEAIAPGETIVEIKGVGVELVKIVKVIVTPKEYKIETDKEEYVIEVDSVIEPIITLKNIEAYTIEITNTEIASIDNLTIKGLSVGETTLKILGTGTDLVKEVKITVIPKEYRLETDKEEYTVRIDETVTPVIALKNIENYTLEIENTEIAVIDNQSIKGVKAGETTLKILGTGTDLVKEVKIIVIPNESYTIDESIKVDNDKKLLSGISETTKVADIKSKIVIIGLTLETKDVNGKILTDEDLIGTGTTITLLREDGTEYDKLTFVVYGDVNGDGYIFANDYVLIKNYIMGDGDLTTIGQLAADVSRDAFVYANDYVLIKNYIMGDGTIAQ